MFLYHVRYLGILMIDIHMNINGFPGGRPTKAYDVTIQRYRNSHAKIEKQYNAYFAVYGFKILCEILNPYSAKYVFYQVLKFDNLWYLRVMTS